MMKLLHHLFSVMTIIALISFSVFVIAVPKSIVLKVIVALIIIPIFLNTVAKLVQKGIIV